MIEGAAGERQHKQHNETSAWNRTNWRLAPYHDGMGLASEARLAAKCDRRRRLHQPGRSGSIRALRPTQPPHQKL